MAGPSGAVSYPDYIEYAHGDMVGVLSAESSAVTVSITSMLEIVDEIQGSVANPYTGITAYDPSYDIELIEDDLETLRSQASDIDEITTWEDFIDAIDGKISTILPTDDDLDADVVAYEEGMEITLADAYARMAGGLRAINGVVGTAFPSAMAILEARNAHDIAQYRARLHTRRYGEEMQVFLNSVQAMTGLLTAKMSATNNVVNFQDAIAKTAITAYDAEITRESEIRRKEAFWDLEVIREGATVIGATAGIPGMAEGLTDKQMQLNAIANGIMITTSMASTMMGSIGGGFASMIPLLGLR